MKIRSAPFTLNIGKRVLQQKPESLTVYKITNAWHESEHCAAHHIEGKFLQILEAV